MLTNYQMWQLEKYGNIAGLIDILPDGTNINGVQEMRRLEEWVKMQSCELENGREEAEQFTDWMNDQAELQMEQEDREF